MLQTLLLLFVKVEPILLPLIIVVLLIKIADLLNFKMSRWKVVQLVYVNTNNLVKSKSFEKVSMKIAQNYMPFYLVFLVIIKILIRIHFHR